MVVAYSSDIIEHSPPFLSLPHSKTSSTYSSHSAVVASHAITQPQEALDHALAMSTACQVALQNKTVCC